MHCDQTHEALGRLNGPINMLFFDAKLRDMYLYDDVRRRFNPQNVRIFVPTLDPEVFAYLKGTDDNNLWVVYVVG